MGEGRKGPRARCGERRESARAGGSGGGNIAPGEACAGTRKSRAAQSMARAALGVFCAALFGSCSFFAAVGHGIAVLFFFALKTALFLGGGIGCGYLLYSYYEDEEKNKRRKNKADTSEKLFLGFLCYLAGVFGFCLYFKSPPVWVLITGAVGCLLFFICPRALKMPFFVWLVTLPVFTVVVFLAALFTGLWKTALDAGALVSKIIPVDVHFAIPVNFWTMLLPGGLLACIPAIIAGSKNKRWQEERRKKSGWHRKSGNWRGLRKRSAGRIFPCRKRSRRLTTGRSRRKRKPMRRSLTQRNNCLRQNQISARETRTKC